MKLSAHCYVVPGLSHSDYFSVNAGFIACQQETILIDSGHNQESAMLLFHYAQAVKLDNTISHVINLEAHADHTFGNGFLKKQGVQIIAHHTTRLSQADLDQFIAEANEQITIESRKINKEAAIYFDGVESFTPDISLIEDRTFIFDPLEIVVHLAPGHTPSNMIVHVPLDRVLFVGDTLYSKFLPTLRFGDVELWRQWLKALEWIESAQPEIIVPGHGPIITKKRIKQELTRHRDILHQHIRKTK